MRTIVALDPVAGTITLDSPPGTTTAGLAIAAYGMIVRFATYGDATASQRQDFAWIADEGTQLLDGSDGAKRWAG